MNTNHVLVQVKEYPEIDTHVTSQLLEPPPIPIITFNLVESQVDANVSVIKKQNVLPNEGENAQELEQINNINKDNVCVNSQGENKEDGLNVQLDKSTTNKMASSSRPQIRD